MNFDSKIDDYILAHTESEDELLRELNRQTHLKIHQPRMLSGHLQGKILQMLSNMIQPKTILEIGSYTGYSAICLSKGLQKGGELHTIEINDEIAEFTHSYFEKAGLLDKVKFHIGSAIDIVPEMNMQFDLVFLDGDKRQYLDYYHLVFEKVKPGGYIFADNVLWSSKVVEELKSNDLYTKGILDFNDFVQNDSRVENVLMPFRDGMMVLRKI